MWRQRIDDFLQGKRLAMVGVSRNSKDFSRGLFREFLGRGYEMAPVNPAAGEIDGMRCYGSVAEIPLPVDGVLLMTPPAETERVVRQCAAAGIRRVWMYRAAGQGAVSDAAVQFCEKAGIDVIAGYCPYMFFDRPGWFHSAHAALLKVVGKYPH